MGRVQFRRPDPAWLEETGEFSETVRIMLIWHLA